MKKITFYLAFLVLVTSCAMQGQLVSFKDDPFVKVFENLDSEQDELYTKANQWMISVFNNAESVIQHQDKEQGVIIGKYLIKGTISRGLYGVTADSRVFAIIDVRVRDGKARLEITPDDYNVGFDGYTKEVLLQDLNALAQSLADKLSEEDIDF